MTVSLKRQTISGLKWTTFSTYLQKGLSVLTFIILARLLEPADFGLFAMAFIVIDGLGMMKDLGVNAALVQRKDSFEMATHTAFWMMPLFGSVIICMLYFGAPLAAVALNEDSLIPVIRTLALIFLIGSFERVPVTLMRRELMFKELAIREFIAAFMYMVCAVVLAKLNFGVWSLVYAYLLRRVVMFFLAWSITPYRPRFVFDMKISKDLLHFGKFIFGATLVGFGMANLDNFFIGSKLGADSLGYYAIAYNVSSITITHLAMLLNRVMYPVFSKMQDDLDGIRSISLKMMRILAICTLPFGIVLLLLAEQIVTVVYGVKWLPMVPVLQVLALCSILLPVFSLVNNIYTACGKPKWSFNFGIIQLGMMLALVPVFISHYGLIGGAVAVTISKLIVIPWEIIYMKKLINMGFRDMIMVFAPPVKASFFLVLVILFGKFLYSLYMPGVLSNLFVFAPFFIFIGCIYVGCIFLFDRKIIIQFKELILNRA
jgi:O-antigen/teichoic acid export membrane protein